MKWCVFICVANIMLAAVFHLMVVQERRNEIFEKAVQHEKDGLIRSGATEEEAEKLAVQYWTNMREKHPEQFM